MNATQPNVRMEELLAKLKAGDVTAAEQLFLAYEPYLRLLVRRQLSAALRAKFDSPDIVQSVWVDLLRGFRDSGCRFASAEHLRAYLIRATRNRFIDRLRRYEKALDREQPLESVRDDELPCSGQPDPSAELQADDLWKRMLSLCPPAHREVLLLRRQGCQLTEIATRTGLHEGSVRRLLYELARRVAAHLTARAAGQDSTD
ncbi:MAG TPA: sigma-70 family RNA polymerase sigma factor [Gemmataceae bacterium]|nr:sigma-70 family RNA polymerase sigma factor [Gemmataceae bacterium]